MAGAKGAAGPQNISRGHPAYPALLIHRLGESAPQSITAVGPPASLSLPMTALLCSRDTPGGAILKVFDQAAAWREAGRCVVSGFHSDRKSVV